MGRKTDIANLGIDIYQSRQISNMHKEMGEMGNSIQMQILSMQMAQESEASKKKLIIEARKMVLEIEDQVEGLRQEFDAYPANTSIQFDILLNMIEQSPLGDDLFEEFQDIERYRATLKIVADFGNWLESEMSDENQEIKKNILDYVNEEEDLVKAISVAKKRKKLAEDREEALNDFEKTSEKWDASQSDWDEKEAEIEDRKVSLQKTAKIAIPAGLVLACLILVINSLGIAISTNQSKDIFNLVLYISWAIPLLQFLKYLGNPVIPSDDPLRILRDSLPAKESLISKMDSKLLNLVPLKFEGRDTVSELEILLAERLKFVDKHSPNIL